MKATGAQLTTTLSSHVPAIDAPNRDLTQAARALARAREERREWFGDGLFRNPAWDMLLQLYVSERAQEQITVSGLCLASGAPWSTALRHFDLLVAEGLAERIEDDRHRRRVWVRPTRKAMDGVERFLERAAPGFRSLV